ncbi:MAG TPA: ATP-binding protein [Candidatus Paceibacterota bacterium]|nr:ATP-binding protein [Candidatus Paceibacterota bacterium]
MEKSRTALFASPHIALLTPLFESMPDQVLVVGADGILLFVNRAFAEAGTERFGATFVAGKSIFNTSKKSILVDQSIWSRVIAGEEFSLTEEQQVRGKSTESIKKYYEMHFVPIISDKKKVLGAAAFIKDVSLLRRAELDLIESRITLQETQALADITRWSFEITDSPLAAAEWDDAFYSIYGVSMNSKKDRKTLFSVFAESDQKALLKKIADAIAVGEHNIAFDTSFLHPKLGRRYVHTLGKIDRDNATFVGVSHDITDIKAAQIALESQNKELENTKIAMLNVLEDAQVLERKTQEKVMQLNAILSSMREALVAVDSNMKVVLINQAAAALFRIAPADAIGKPVSKLCSFYLRDVKLAEKETPLKKAVAEKTIVSYSIADELSILDQQKVKVPVACTASYLVGELSVRAIMILRDITKEKEIDTTKTELISLASHQLRTPLSSVNWYSEMLLSGDAGPINEEQRSYITEIYKGNQRMIDLVNALLNVSRADLGTIHVEAEMVSLKEISDGVIADLTPLITEKEIAVDVGIPAKISSYSGDKRILTIIFQNLVSNSVKYTPPKGKVKVKVENRKKGEIVAGHELRQDSLLFSVSDNGYGIPEGEKAKIFTKLYRADNIRGLEANGNGLGLYLVKSMIESIGGSVWFISEEKKGTTFYVALPAKGMQNRVGTTMFT